MVAPALDVVRPEIRHALEALGSDHRRAADARVGDPRLRDLEEDAPERVVLVLVAERLRDGPEADVLEELGIPERDDERDRELHLPAGLGDRDPLRAEQIELRRGVRAGRDRHVELAVHHAVGAEGGCRELVLDRRVHVRVVARVRREPDAECRQELVVGDELDLGADDTARDLELLLLRKEERKLRDDPVVLAREKRLGRRQRQILVRPHVAGDHRLVGHPHKRAHQIHRRGRRCVAARVRPRQVVVREQQRSAVVRGVAVDRAVAQPVEPRVRDAVDLRGVDVAADRVVLLPRRHYPGALSGRRAEEVQYAEVVLKLLQRILCVEGHRHVLGGGLVPEADVVVDELAPDPAPLRDPVLREDVLPDIVEDGVADMTRRRARDHLSDAVGVVRGRDPQVLRAGLPPVGMEHVVPASVQRSI